MKLYRVDAISEYHQYLNACYVYAETGFEARKLGKVWIADSMGDMELLDSDSIISRVASEHCSKYNVDMDECIKVAINKEVLNNV